MLFKVPASAAIRASSCIAPTTLPVRSIVTGRRLLHSTAATNATTVQRDHLSSAGESRASRKPVKKLSEEHHRILDEIMRVDQAGEIGANFIYKGQLAILGRDKKVGPLIEHMWQQEVHHLETFNKLVPTWRARPSLLYPVWQAAGFAVGAGSALLGKEAAMALTEAVETVIGEHYNDQIRSLLQILEEDGSENLERRDEIVALVETLKRFRDEELEHLDTAVEHDAAKAPAHTVLNSVFKAGCKAVIEVAKRV
ncbi:ubiquinone biosynthesis protein COQ7-domain-containing protein [Catenaria anguillulae PL171]|uniref:5-demethoxyubiquinone hydroxylase, mitochondrial n=1 Tax=Catenaria anguillulae PL171 TaxID=765915 RepID=A0A1Y2HFR7_9FUNG|nr:ubiquinone biosynthesis protein COQ7-domain-containing protein [Catenaria anguillulae PL171]